MSYQQYPSSPDPSQQPTSGQPEAYGGYGYGYGYAAPVVPKTNSLAIASLVVSLCGLACTPAAPVGAILGHVARRQIRERGESGDGMALAGIIVGWILTAIMIVVIIFYIVVVVLAIRDSNVSG